MKWPNQLRSRLSRAADRFRERKREDTWSEEERAGERSAPPEPEGGLGDLRSVRDVSFVEERTPKLLFLSPDQLLEGDGRPRRNFSDSALLALADSIRQHGLLHPVTVRRLPGRGERYAVVAGERRLRAMEILGRKKVPCLLAEVGPGEAALLSLAENMQREPLTPFETADTAARLQKEEAPPLTEGELAGLLSVSEERVRGLLSLRCFSERERQLLLAAELPEEAMLAMTKAESGEDRLAVLKAVCLKYAEEGSTAAYVRDCLTSSAAAAKIGGARKKLILGDIRVFYNTVDRAVATVREAGIPAVCRQEEGEDRYRITIEIPKAADPEESHPLPPEEKCTGAFHVEQPEEEAPLPEALRRQAPRTVEIPALH